MSSREFRASGDEGRRTWRACAAALLLISILQFGWQAWLTAHGPDYCASQLTVDDTYYYLQTAWNFKHLGFPSFDGISRTNGVQFLWFWCVALIAAVATSRPALLILTLLVCAVMNAACYYPIWRLGRLVGRPWFLLVLALCWFYVTLHSYLLGMENALNAFLMWSVLAAVLRAAGDQGKPRLLVPTLLLGLLVWSRLDQALIALPLAGWLLHGILRTHGLSRRMLKSIGSSAVIGGAMAAILFLGFRWMGASWLPISGIIKQESYAWSPVYLGSLLLKGFETSFPPYALLQYGSYHGFGHAGAVSWVLLAAVGLAAMVLFSFRAYWEGLDARRARGLCITLALAVLMHVAYLAGLREYAMYGVWYFSPLHILIALTCAFAFDAATALLAGRSRLLASGVGGTICLAAGLCIALDLRWKERNSREYQQGEFYAQIRLARWLDAHIELGVRCAAWNAGILGYFCEHPVINLDGLINSREYYETVLRGKVSVLEYLRRQRVAYVIDDEQWPEVQRASTVVASFPMPGYTDGRRKYVWRLRPPENPRSATREE